MQVQDIKQGFSASTRYTWGGGGLVQRHDVKEGFSAMQVKYIKVGFSASTRQKGRFEGK